ncbi:hypothetical protein ACI48D_20335 [Massilia sp. LXY-6]|uniref:hypothetical protein n=1 Tax=Massilia sp. LXY-6 TaxID=3379823 RepID=UPI003EDE85F2
MMTYTFPEELHVDGKVYHLYSYPLEPYVAARPSWPRFPKRPWNTNGYMATWAVEDGGLYLTHLSAPGDDPMALLFPQCRGPVPAFWLDGMLWAVRGEWRHTGYPPRRTFDDEVYLEIRAGKVTRQWSLDLRSVPDQTDEELRLSLPRFLWPRRLQDGGAGQPE